ncbi:hypothetical protein A3C37_03365 [Candidatus Peribacteria bacterium RIFCSPHIGHO2_02_FULL_53_20]|nr:MAG: hypothetical protein A3C37_03365 [Candidatus Peribacteria bacterium RIFCSPHIGHO2_02_FULL_53_20]OGJ67390.1 MAG: hypothetical protein A3B61_00460 [Candidatus Peribacteria bacterium RIFCSPLOWO2_01_FULL_53_10]OGJ72633.1 MAG: hypothetical protein A3G69_01800 [Candidatus Peribacteria bacterium RIFCSPLOWO2_12_FULL_53_10]
MTNDNIQPLQDRIAKIVGDEERLNRNRLTALKVKTDRRDSEKRTENADLETLDRKKEQQIRVNADKERKFLDELKREGAELVHLSKELQHDHTEETRRRGEAKEKLQAKVTALEAKLRNVAGARP